MFASLYENDFVIYDTYGKYNDYVSLAGGVVANNEYYLGTPKNYKVVGVIDTGLLDFFTYDTNQKRYLFNPDFKNQDNDRYAIFMNSAKSQPFGYVVLQEHLDNSLKEPFYYGKFEIENLSINGYSLKNKNIQTFIGEYDFTTNPAEMYDRFINNAQGTHKQYDLVGYEDNLLIDRSYRIVAKSTNEEHLKDNEVILTSELAKKLYPNLSFNNSNQIKNSFESIKNQEITLGYNNGYANKNITVKIVGISNGTEETFYASNDVYE